jgi:hypothetical protein
MPNGIAARRFTAQFQRLAIQAQPHKRLPTFSGLEADRNVHQNMDNPALV